MEQLGGITIGSAGGRSRIDAGANWSDQRGLNRAVALTIMATWACCWRMSAEHGRKRGARTTPARADIGIRQCPHWWGFGDEAPV